MLHDFMAKLQKDLDLKEPLGGPDDSTYALALEDTIIAIMDKSPGFALSCNLGPLPSQEIEDFFTNMLRGNLFGQTIRYAALGLDETGNNVLLQYHFPQKTTYKDLHNAVEDFINVIDFWKRQINDHPASSF